MSSPSNVARAYGLLVGAALLIEGGALLILEALGFAGDTRHSALHVAWGTALLALLLPRGGRDRAWLVLLVFGVFYTGLAVAGVVVNSPLGLSLGAGENVFHFTVGPLALGLGMWAARHRASEPSSSSDSSAATRASASAPPSAGDSTSGAGAPR